MSPRFVICAPSRYGGARRYIAQTAGGMVYVSTRPRSAVLYSSAVEAEWMLPEVKGTYRHHAWRVVARVPAPTRPAQ